VNAMRASVRVLIALVIAGCGSPGKSRVFDDPDSAIQQGGEDGGLAGDTGTAGNPEHADVTSISSVGDGPGSTFDSPGDTPGVDVGPSPYDADSCATPASCCKGCWDGTKCLAGTDVKACGGNGGACKTCDDGNPCTADKCSAGICDADKLTGATCSTGVCASGVCHCGGTGEPCCAQGTACEGGQACQNSRCGSCGSTGLPCCAGNQCGAGSTCNAGNGSCETCGASGQLCCGSGQCNNGFLCGGNGRCTACGGTGQTCCPSGNACQSNLTCGAGNTCQCGGIGQPCCGGSSCTNDGNPCNGSEVCLGTCQHQSPIICAASDSCHDVGQCQPSTGTCTNPPKTGGACNDNNACTTNDTCMSGVCQGTTVMCASGQRCSGGACVCDGTSCPSGCCSGTSCQAGTADSSCGSNGNSCAMCTSGTQTCQNHACAAVACGGLGQPCCAGSSCTGGRICGSSNVCMNEKTYDCPVVASLTNGYLYNENTTVGGPAIPTDSSSEPDSAEVRVGHDFFHLQPLLVKMFITFDCSLAPARTNLRSAFLQLYLFTDQDATQTDIQHVTFSSLDNTAFFQTPIGQASTFNPTANIGYRSFDVMTSVQADFSANRNLTQFRAEGRGPYDANNARYITFFGANTSNVPKLTIKVLAATP
jgi:hypothetical protein